MGINLIAASIVFFVFFSPVLIWLTFWIPGWLVRRRSASLTPDVVLPNAQQDWDAEFRQLTGKEVVFGTDKIEALTSSEIALRKYGELGQQSNIYAQMMPVGQGQLQQQLGNPYANIGLSGLCGGALGGLANGEPFGIAGGILGYRRHQ